MSTSDLETPYYLIDETELTKNTNQLKEALRVHWGNSIIGYSFKTNSFPWLIEYMRDIGCYAEVVSDDEYNLAIESGYKNNKIIYNGPIKSKETFIEAIENGCIVNIDAKRELDWLSELQVQESGSYEIGIRVNFDLEKYCPGESAMGAEGGRFGFCYENGELAEAIQTINKYRHIKLVGIHLHCSTKTRSLKVYQIIARMACEIKRQYGLELRYVDVGGGFFGGLEDKPQFDDYIRVISEELDKEFNKNNTTLIVEPGTSIVSSPIDFVTSVIDVKEITINKFIVTDASRNNIDPLMSKSNYFFKLEYRDRTNNGNDNLYANRLIVDKQVISGYTCMEDDRLFILRDSMELLAGDKVIYKKVGAYTMALSPLFIKYFPAVYLKTRDGEYKKLMAKWRAKDYYRLHKNLNEL